MASIDKPSQHEFPSISLRGRQTRDRLGRNAHRGRAFEDDSAPHLSATSSGWKLASLCPGVGAALGGDVLISNEDLWPVADRVAAAGQKPVVHTNKAHGLVADLNQDAARISEVNVALILTLADWPVVKAVDTAR